MEIWSFFFEEIFSFYFYFFGEIFDIFFLRQKEAIRVSLPAALSFFRPTPPTSTGPAPLTGLHTANYGRPRWRSRIIGRRKINKKTQNQIVDKILPSPPEIADHFSLSCQERNPICLKSQPLFSSPFLKPPNLELFDRSWARIGGGGGCICTMLGCRRRWRSTRLRRRSPSPSSCGRCGSLGAPTIRSRPSAPSSGSPSSNCCVLGFLVALLTVTCSRSCALFFFLVVVVVVVAELLPL